MDDRMNADIRSGAIHPAPVQFSREQLVTDPILQFFHYAHLPAALQASSRPFCDLAGFLVGNLPRNAERTVALRKLLEAKDAAVRANVGALASGGGSWQDRVKAERDQLSERARKLDHFLEDKTRRVPAEQRTLLERQRGAMREYLEILNERLASAKGVEEGEIREVGGADQDRDGDPPFGG